MSASVPDLLKIAMPMVLAQLPVAGILLSSDEAKKYVGQHPIRTVAICLLYEVAVGLAIKVWKQLEDGVVKGVAEAVKLSCRATWIWLINRLSRFRRHYLQQLCYDYRSFNVRGLLTIGTFNLRLEQAFIELRIAPASPQEATPDPLAHKNLQHCRHIWEFLRQGISEDAHGWAIIGPPGCGKTTLLQHIVLVLAQERQHRHCVPAYVPVLLFLRDHAAALSQQNPPPLGQLAQEWFGKRSGYPAPPQGWFERKLQRGQVLVLLDGLDEVAEEGVRKNVSRWVDEQIQRYPRSRFVVTARPHGYRGAPLARASVLELQLLSQEQVRRFVEGWYLANEIMAAGGKEDRGVRQEAARNAEQLLQRLHDRPALSALTRNPLLLTMVATVHRYRGQLPGRRRELYSEICDVLLGHWQKAKGLAVSLTAAQTRAVLQPLAARLMETQRRDIGTQEALGLMDPWLREVGVSAEGISRFLVDLQASSGLMVEREQGLWSFAHLTFQEYLAACHYRSGALALPLDEMIQDSWWHEMLRLYAAQEDATALVQACMELDDVPALTLASECLDEALRIQQEVRAAVVQRLIAGLESADPARRWLAAQVRLNRRLRGSMQRLDEEREIDLGYVTCAEYQLFIGAGRERGGRQPDHWMAERFSIGQAAAPVCGVRAEDAEEFCRWLNDRWGAKDMRYRLPTALEAQEHPAERRDLAAWCQQGELIGMDDEHEGRLSKELAGVCPEIAGNGQHASRLMMAFRFDRDRDLARDRDLDLALALALDLDLNLDLALDLDLARDLNLSRARDLALSDARDLARDRALSRARNRDRDLNLARARALALARALDLARDLDRDFDRDHDLSLARARARVRARDLARARDRAVAVALARALDLDLASVGARARDLDLTRALDRALNQGDLTIARVILSELTPTWPRWVKVLAALIEQAAAADIPQLRREKYHYFLVLGDLALEGFAVGQPARKSWFRWRHPATSALNYTYRHMQELHWWLQIVQAREQGRLPAWEGIRLVCERRKP